MDKKKTKTVCSNCLNGIDIDDMHNDDIRSLKVSTHTTILTIKVIFVYHDESKS